MKILKSTVGLLLTLLILAGAFAFYIQLQVTKQEKEIKSLKSEVANLEDDKQELQDKVSELEEDLSKVQHFDDDASVKRGFSSGNSENIAFTGSVYEGNIDGEFTGWEGESIFKMMDGSVWQQSSYAYTYHYAYMPSVIIFSKDGGTYMKVEDVDEQIEVRRIN